MKLNESPRIELRNHAQLSESDADVLDLATTGNLAPPPAPVVEALREVALNAYPDPSALRARRAIAARLGTSPDCLLLGNGATELLWTCGRTLAGPEQSVIAVMPGPGELAAAARASGARIVQWRAVERTGHTVELEQVRELMQLERPGLVDLCAPAWPSGAKVPFEALQRMAAAFPETAFVVDQSELELSEQFGELELAPPANVVCVRSIGKSLGLHGLRVGYLWASPAVCAHLERRRPSFACSSPALAAAELWPKQAEYVATCRARLLADRDRLGALLAGQGLASTRSVTGALLVRVTRASLVAEELLARFRIAVRDCTPYGLPDHLRIAGVSELDAPRLRNALAEVLARLGISGGRET